MVRCVKGYSHRQTGVLFLSDGADYYLVWYTPLPHMLIGSLRCGRRCNAGVMQFTAPATEGSTQLYARRGPPACLPVCQMDLGSGSPSITKAPVAFVVAV